MTPSTPLRPWLFAIAANLVRSQRRAEARQLRAYSRLDARGEADGDMDATQRRLDATRRGPAIARAAHRALTDGDRDTLLLVAWGDLTYEDAARALAVPVGTGRSRLHRARGVVCAEEEHHG